MHAQADEEAQMQTRGRADAQAQVRALSKPLVIRPTPLRRPPHGLAHGDERSSPSSGARSFPSAAPHGWKGWTKEEVEGSLEELLGYVREDESSPSAALAFPAGRRPVARAASFIF